MFDLTYDYATCVRNSEKVAWRVDEVMSKDARLDFSRPFLPAGLTGSGRLAFLTAPERLTLNHINANAYVNLFAFVEEYIVATAVNHAQAEMFGDHSAIRALVRFADEEIKHQELFWRYLEAFKRDFPHSCEVLGSAAAVAQVILSKSPMSVMMITLHLEIMTQAHYTESMRPEGNLDPLFARLFKHHWLEECQHAKIDALELDKMVAAAGPDQIKSSFSEYLELVDAFDGLLAEQARMDLDSLAGALERPFTEAEGEQILQAQHAGYRRTFLVSGMVNPMFTKLLVLMDPESAAVVARKAESLKQ